MIRINITPDWLVNAYDSYERFCGYYTMYRRWRFSGVQAVIGSAWIICWLPDWCGKYMPLFGLGKDHTSWAEA